MNGTTTTGVPHAQELVAFANAAIGADVKSLDLARIGGFDGITRIADATGIPLEPPKAAQTTDLRVALRIDEFIAAKW